MTHEETQAALLAAAEAARLRGIENPFTGLTTRITVHHQFGGNYVGEDHVKVFHNGMPSHLCMLRPVDAGFECLSFKRGAAEMPIVIKPEPDTHERERAGDPSEEIDGLNRLADAYDRLTQSVKAANEQLEGLGSFGRVRVEIVGEIVECEITSRRPASYSVGLEAGKEISRPLKDSDPILADPGEAGKAIARLVNGDEVEIVHKTGPSYAD